MTIIIMLRRSKNSSFVKLEFTLRKTVQPLKGKKLQEKRRKNG